MQKSKVALTFDDGPCGFTEKILDTLEAHKACASFFVLGSKVASNKGTIQRAHAAGNEIISHSWSHCKNPCLSELDADAIKKELRDTQAAIRSVVSVPEKSPMLMRPPYGKVSDTLKSVTRELDYAIVNWSVDPLDWECLDADIVFDRIMSLVHDGAIILSHDVHASTAQAMERVIPSLLEKYQLVTLSELLQDTVLQAGEVYEKV